MNPIVLSNAISFVGVALALWLGFFNLTRSPQRTLARAGALALWAAGGLFLAALLGSSQLPELDNPAWLVPFRWPAYFVPVLWLHLASALRPPALSSTPQAAIWEPLRSPAAYTGLRPWLLLLYSVAVLLAALDTLAPRLFLPLDPPPTFALTFFLLYALYALACVGLSASNLRSAYQRADAGTPLRPALDWLIRGYLLTGLGGLLLAVAQAGLLADLALLAGIALTGYSLARITALLDGRSVQGDFVYTLLAIALVCAAYLSATLFTYVVYGIPFVTFVFILMLTVISHSLYDWTRTTLDRLFFHGPTRELRANLRTLAHEAGGDEGLRTNLHALLAALCQSLGVSRAAVLLRAEDGYIIDSVVGSISSAQPLPAALFDALELTRLSHPTPLGEMALLVPLRLMDRQEGALLLGLREHGGEYSSDDEALVVEVADRMEYLLAQLRLREERTRQLNEQLAQFRESERALQMLAAQDAPIAAAGLNEKELVAGVEDALRHLSDVAYLGALALCRLRVVLRRLEPGAATNLDRGRVLKEVLVEALDKLRPAGSEPKTQGSGPQARSTGVMAAGSRLPPGSESQARSTGVMAAGSRLPPGSEWYSFLILREAYLVGVPNQEIMTRLYISEGTFNRTRRRAIRAIARALSEMESIP